MDELHMVNDDGRGYLMELLATKISTLDAGIQVVGMSATLTVKVLPLICWTHG